MASTVSELLVRIRPEGVDQTTDALDEQSEAFQDAAGEAQEQTGLLEEFSNRWQGAMQVFITGLSIAAAGLLANVPVLGEALAAMGTILRAVAFQMDKVLRPVLMPIMSAVFDLSNAIFELNGPLGTLVGIAGTVASTLISIVAASTILNGLLGGLSGTIITGIVSALSTLASVIATVITAAVAFVAAVLGVSVAVAAAIVALIAAIVAFAIAYITNFRGVRDKTNEFVGQVIEFIKGMASSIATTLTDLVSAAFRAGRNLINELIRGLRSRLSALRRMANRVAQAVRDRLPGSPAKTGPLADLDRVGPGLVDTFAEGMERNTGRLATASGRVATASDPRGGGMGGGSGGGAVRQLKKLVAAMQNNTQTHVFEVDGRELAKVTSPFIGSGAVNVGATGVRR